MDGRERYDEVCKGEFQSLHKKMDILSRRLFIDNGAESIQSRMNRLDLWIGRATKIGLAIAIAVFGLCIEAVQEIIKNIIH